MPEGPPMTQISMDSQSPLAPWRARSAALMAVILLSMSGIAWLLDGVREGGDLSIWDRPTLVWLVAHREPMTTTVVTAVTTVGGEVVLSVVAVLTVLLLAVRRRRLEAFLLAVALGSAETISVVLKHVVGRARPPRRPGSRPGGTDLVVSLRPHDRDGDVHPGAGLPVVASATGPRAGMARDRRSDCSDHCDGDEQDLSRRPLAHGRARLDRPLVRHHVRRRAPGHLAAAQVQTLAGCDRAGGERCGPPTPTTADALTSMAQRVALLDADARVRGLLCASPPSGSTSKPPWPVPGSGRSSTPRGLRDQDTA